MSRVIPQRVYWIGSLAEARASLQPCIEAFVAAANRGHRSTPAAAPLDAIAHQLLDALQAGRPMTLHFANWPPWFFLAFLNIHANVKSGDYHLGPCGVCRAWMLVKSSARERCNRPACRRVAATRRQRQHRARTEGTIARANGA
jgi:hypothetical protein